MCDCCADLRQESPRGLNRRHFLKLAAALTAGSLIGRSFADSPATPPKPGNVLSPEAALKRLMAGNQRYVSGSVRTRDFDADRSALTLGQNPFAGILGCADSRVTPEYAFDTGRGDLFVCRVAGNFAETDDIASFEYAVAVLGVPLILVLGHGNCGAVASTIKAVKDGEKFPGHISSLVRALRPAVQQSLDQPGDLLDNAIRRNVLLNVARLKKTAPILSKAVEERRLLITGGIYDLRSGRVSLLS